MPLPTKEEIKKGQNIYNPLSLRIYNLFVLGFSCRFVWQCHTNHTVKFYSENITSNHLDVGVGTGYILDHCQFPDKQPSLALLDLNDHCLRYTKKLLNRYQPKTYQADIYQPLNTIEQKFDSIGLNYVLHCLPGTFAQKSDAVKNLSTCLTDDGVLFGSTILAKDQKHNWLGKKLLTIYNNKGIFGNWQDDKVGLEEMLKEHFSEVDVKVIGTVAFFVAKK